jgi:hypothetical protein
MCSGLLKHIEILQRITFRALGDRAHQLEVATKYVLNVREWVVGGTSVAPGRLRVVLDHNLPSHELTTFRIAEPVEVSLSMRAHNYVARRF